MEYNCLACAFFFLKNQVDTSCISQEFLYKLFFDLTNQQLTCTPVHLVLGVFCIPLKDRERENARASIKPTGILHGWGNPEVTLT